MEDKRLKIGINKENEAEKMCSSTQANGKVRKNVCKTAETCYDDVGEVHQTSSSRRADESVCLRDGHDVPINVYLRIKPSDTVCTGINGNVLTFNNETFSFTKIFTRSSQNEIFEEIGKAMVINTIKGYNSTIFAYGQTGSGKTYTVKGDVHRPGIVPRVFHFIFNCGSVDSVQMSMLEIYNEQLIDLLSNEYANGPGSTSNKTLSIRESVDSGIYVSNLTQLTISCYETAMAVYETGYKRRTTSETIMNRESSRSHCVLVLYFRSADGVISKMSKINIVDLAGSERFLVPDDDHMADRKADDSAINSSYFGACASTSTARPNIRETGSINKSLLSLREVIKKLCKKESDHINYRDSKLTFLLKDSLGGSSNLTVIGNIDPGYKMESLHTLRFLQRAKQIKNTPTLTTDIKGDLCDIKRELAIVYGRNKELEIKLREKDAISRQCGDDTTRKRIYHEEIEDIKEDIIRVKETVQYVKNSIHHVILGRFDRNRQIISKLDDMLKRSKCCRRCLKRFASNGKT